MRNKEYFSTSKVLLLLLLSLLLISFLLISGCTPISNLLFGASGSIEVTTYPSGAKIFLNDKDTGFLTPYTIVNLPKGTYEVKLTLGDVSYTKTVIVYADNTTSLYKDLLARLNKIVVEPTSMNLEVGESQKIDSVTAYYVDSGSVNLTLSNCSYSSSSSHATVNSSGTVTGVSEGSATITVSYTDVEITKTDTVDITVKPFVPPPVVTPVVYRAFCIGIDEYVNADGVNITNLEGPSDNVNRIIQVFGNCKFGTGEVEFSTPVSLKNLNATKTAIISGIASTFSGADENDVSYFYFAGHGGWDFNTCYICPTDILLTSYDNEISVNELESALSAIPGTKVVILDSCHSGGFIGKGKGKITNFKEKAISFNDEIINVFSQAQSKGLLTTNQYKVLTASHYDQPSYGGIPYPFSADSDPCSYFNAFLCHGCGYDDGILYADWIDVNTKVSLQELYLYIKINIESTPLGGGFFVGDFQDTQAFPEDSNFTIVEY